MISTGHPRVCQLFGRNLRAGMLVEADGGCVAQVMSLERRFPNGQLLRAVLQLKPAYDHPFQVEHILERTGPDDRLVTVSTKETPK